MHSLDRHSIYSMFIIVCIASGHTCLQLKSHTVTVVRSFVVTKCLLIYDRIDTSDLINWPRHRFVYHSQSQSPGPNRQQRLSVTAMNPFPVSVCVSGRPLLAGYCMHCRMSEEGSNSCKMASGQYWEQNRRVPPCLVIL